MLKLPRRIAFSKTFKIDWEYPLIRGIKKVWGLICGKESK